jgi:hypothetical protein
VAQMTLPRVAALVGLTLVAGTGSVLAQASGAQATTAALPSAVRVLAPSTPLRSGPGVDNPTVFSVAAGTLLDVTGRDGDWYRIALSPDIGLDANIPRTVYVLVRLVEPAKAESARPPSGAPAQRTPESAPMPPLPQAGQGDAVRAQPAPAAQPANAKPLQFDGAKLTYQQGSDKKEVDCAVIYGDDTMTIAPYKLKKSQPDPTVAMKYADIASAEYTFGKSPRVAAALLLSPLFLFSSSKSHWLTVKAKSGDYALLRLDKGNYKLVMAELEKRARIKVESVGEGK